MIDNTEGTEESLRLFPYDPRFAPAVPPPAGVFDYPTYSICINAQWWSHVEGVIDRLTWRDAWKGTPEEQQTAADEAIKILGVIAGAIQCGEPSMFRLRQNVGNPCLLEQSYDGGETWLTAFNYALCDAGGGAVTIDITAGLQIINNNTTIYNTDPDDFRPEIEAMDAATNAAICHALNMVIRGILSTLIARKQADYTQQILTQAAAGAMATGAAFVFGTPFSGLAVAIGVAGGLIATAIIDGVDDDDLQAVLNSEVLLKELVCCAYEALMDTRPTQTTFGNALDGCTYSTVVDAVVPGVVALMEDFNVFLQFLDAAGQAHEYATAGVLGNDCDGACDEWCYEWSFSGGLNTWSFQQVGGQNFGVVATGGIADTKPTTAGSRGAGVQKNMGGAAVNKIELIYDRTAGTYGVGGNHGVRMANNGTQFTYENAPGVSGTNLVYTVTGARTLGTLLIQVNAGAVTPPGDPGGSLLLKAVRLYGEGTNPFGVSNC